MSRNTFILAEENVIIFGKLSTYINLAPNKLLTVAEKPVSFLPLEYYNVEEEASPEELIERYRDPKTKKTPAFSKWFANDGTFEWKPCEVESFDNEKEQYRITWKHNQVSKLVSRYYHRSVKLVS